MHLSKLEDVNNIGITLLKDKTQVTMIDLTNETKVFMGKFQAILSFL